MPNIIYNRRLNAPASSLDASTIAWVNAVVAAGGSVSAARQTIVNTLITSLKTHSLWTIQDRIWLHASENSQQATIDIVNLGVATPVNSPTFTADQGYAGNGSSSYLDSGLSASSATNYVRDSGSVSSYVRTSRSSGAGGVNIGFHAAASTGSMTALFTYTNGFINYDLNNAQFTAQVGGQPNAQGFFTSVRTGASAQAVYKNSSSTAVATNTTSSIAVPALNFFIGARNQDATPVNYLSDQLAITTIGSGMTDGTNVAQFQTDLNAYMTSLGTNVY
jgi:hypothetical protein